MSRLKELPQARAAAIVNTIMAECRDNDMRTVDLLAEQVFEDGRVGVVAELVSAYPVPVRAAVAPAQQDVEAAPDAQETQRKEMNDRLTMLRATLPGLFSHGLDPMPSPFPAVRQPVERALTAFRSELDSHPVWRSALAHESATIRRMALDRLVEANSTLTSAALVLLAGDPASRVAMRVRAIMDERAGALRASKSRASARDRALLGTVAGIVCTVATLSGDDSLTPYLSDPRERVRYAVACRVHPDSALWLALACDESARVRLRVAERCPLEHKGIHDRLLKDPVQSIRTIAGKRQLAHYGE